MAAIRMVGQLQECMYRVASDVENSHMDVDVMEQRIQALYDCVVQLQQSALIDLNPEAVDLIQSVLTALTAKNNACMEVHSHGRGRPRYDISKDHLQWLVERDFSGTRIAVMLGVSEATIRRRLSEFGIRCGQKFANLSNDELDRLVQEVVQENPHSGFRMVRGILAGRGYLFQQHQIQESMRRVDPVGVSLRGLMLNVIKRRCYSVPSPQTMWHIDGNHKLIRWRLVVHGGIDGFSRMIVYLGCANNNKAETVLKLFEAATRKFGTPLTVRSDKGGENVQVARFMFSHPERGPERCSMITGPSTHNQRIERLWRDVFAGVLHLYYSIFTHLEQCGQLDTCSDFDLFCLHYVFLPRINRHLDMFSNGWNNHKLRSEGGSSPLQLWTEGMSLALSMLRDRMDMEDSINDTYGIDWEGPTPQHQGQECNRVEVPNIENPLDEQLKRELQQVVDPLQPSDSYGVDLYERTRQFISLAFEQH